MAPKLNIIIIGGGPAAIAVSSALSQALDASTVSLKLITERTFSVHWPAMLRTVATSEGNWENLSLNPYDKLFASGKPGEVVVGEVVGVEDKTVRLADGRILTYDYLVLATGTVWEGPLALPIDRQDAHRWIVDWQKRFASARSVVVIGGGAAGVELSGELKHFHPDMQVTLVHAGSQLLNDAYPAKFRKATSQALQAKGINVILNDKAQVPEGSYTSVTTAHGVTLQADVVAPVRGGRLNTKFLANFDSSILAANGSVHVLPTLQVPLASGKTNVYAIGDIIDWPQQKAQAKIPPQAAVVTANILSSIKGQPAKKEYTGFMEVIVMPMGPTGGRGFLPILWGIIVGDSMTKMLKGKTLFTDKARQALGQPA